MRDKKYRVAYIQKIASGHMPCGMIKFNIKKGNIA